MSSKKKNVLRREIDGNREGGKWRVRMRDDGRASSASSWRQYILLHVFIYNIYYTVCLFVCYFSHQSIVVVVVVVVVVVGGVGGGGGAFIK